MNPPIDPADRKIVLVSLLLLGLLTVLALLFAPGRETSPGGFPSSYSSAADGAKAAYILLGEMGYRVERWANPPEELPAKPDGILLIVAGPTIPASDEEARQLKEFVAGGGRLLITDWIGAAMIGVHNVRPNFAPAQWQSFTAETPSPLTNHAQEISMETSGRWVSLEKGQQRYYGNDSGAVVTKWHMGRGEIIWWGGSSPLTNYGISKASNLALFLNSVGAPGRTRVLWDEYFHGVRRGLWHYVSHTPLPWALVQLLALAGLVIFTYARRSGAVRSLPRRSRLSPVEFVETVGALYQRKRAAAGALEIAFSRFRFLLARRLAMPASATTSQLIQGADRRSGWVIPGFKETLEQIDSALKLQQVKEQTALEWIGKLDDFSRRLGLDSSGHYQAG